VDRTQTHTSEEPPVTLQQIISVVSGIVGSILSVNAFSKQREASKKRIANHTSNVTAAAKHVRIVQQLGGSLLDAEAESPLFSLGPVPQCTPASNLRAPGRHFTIITTAALPWLTGTAVNPLLRALNLAKMHKPVVLMLPWLEQDNQKTLFPKGQSFESPAAQEEAICRWCKERAKIDPENLPIRFRWYQAKYVENVRSIFPQGDVSLELGEGDPRDVLILEEPEHLCWYHHGQRWPGLFQHVVGIVHTNYQDYLVAHGGDGKKWTKASIVPDELKEASVFASSTIVCSAYCDVNIKLSDTIMPLPNEVTCNVHGVRDEFLQVGDTMGQKRDGEDDHHGANDIVELMPNSKSMDLRIARLYYLGKALYEKGWGELVDLLEELDSKCRGLAIDGFGSGADYDKIVARGERLSESGAILKMHPGIDHANRAIHGYHVLLNPSTSDVLCTVTVEALAMGKQCVLAEHPSNHFFQCYFPSRCHFFRVGDKESFRQAVLQALEAGPPAPLPAHLRHLLTWEAATDRLFDAAEVRILSGSVRRPSEAAASRLAYKLHFDIMEDTGVLADLIKEATLGEQNTPWDEYFEEWRRTQLDKLRKQAEEVGISLQRKPDHIQQQEQYLKERIDELSRIILKDKTG